MPARLLTCASCGRTLGTISRKRDHLGRPRDKLRLNGNVQHVGRALFRGRYALCKCGERVSIPVPDGEPVQFY